MPTLVILRHAEALPSRSDDHARPLTSQGRADAASSGARILATLTQPPLVLASDARRTRETAELAFATAQPAAEIRFLAALYSATVDTLLETVREVADVDRTLALVGHNPGVSKLARKLFMDGDAEGRARVEAGMPTAGVAIYTFDKPWHHLGKRTGRLTATLVPDGKTWSL